MRISESIKITRHKLVRIETTCACVCLVQKLWLCHLENVYIRIMCNAEHCKETVRTLRRSISTNINGVCRMPGSRNVWSVHMNNVQKPICFCLLLNFQFPYRTCRHKSCPKYFYLINNMNQYTRWTIEPSAQYNAHTHIDDVIT